MYTTQGIYMGLADGQRLIFINRNHIVELPPTGGELKVFVSFFQKGLLFPRCR